VILDQYSRKRGKNYEVNMIVTIVQREPSVSFSYQNIGFLYCEYKSLCVQKYACDKSF